MISDLESLGIDFKDEGENYVPKKDYSGNLVAKYVFDSNGISTDNITLKDLSGHGYDGTMSGVSIKDDAELGKCAYFNGSASVNFNNQIIPKGNKTIIITFKKDSGTQSNGQYEFLIEQGSGQGESITSWSIRFDSYKTACLNNLYFCNDDSKINMLNSHPAVFNVCDGKKHTAIFNYYDNKTNNTYCDSLKAHVCSFDFNGGEYRTADNSIIGQKYVGYIKSIEIYDDVVEFNSISTGISLNKNIDQLTIGQTDNLVATIMPEDVTDKSVIWSSSDPSIVAVDENGKITALKAGEVSITVTTKDGSNLSQTCMVAVIDTTIPDKACLNISMTNGQVKQYYVGMDLVNKFISWYKLRSAGSEEPFYEFDITQLSEPGILRHDYVVFNKISSFTVDDYVK
ncbi:hypothetical protein NL50_05740 [Clostridium acetobutylicum]|nr:hypothetical protein NL50_05740 [Clostridium acetobutylicum]